MKQLIAERVSMENKLVDEQRDKNKLNDQLQVAERKVDVLEKNVKRLVKISENQQAKIEQLDE